MYESSSQNLDIELNIEPIKGPMVLVLSSYSTINWIIKNTHKADIKAIVYGSYSPGTSVKGDVASTTLLLSSKKRLGSFRKQASCSCSGGSIFHCEGSGLMPTIRSLESLTKNKVVGFSGKYGASSLKIPEEVIDQSFTDGLQKADAEKEKARLACKKKANPDFESLLD